MSPWERAISQLPRRIRWVHHGRDPLVGLDCVGFVLCAYALKGIDIRDLDVPYGIRDALVWRRAGVVFQRLGRKFDPVAMDALVEGDVLVSRRGSESHLGVVIGQSVWQMTGSGLYRCSITKALVTTERAFRYREQYVVER